jgi:hypothetical protein
MEAMYSSETLVSTCKFTRRCKPQDQHGRPHSRANLKSVSDKFPIQDITYRCATELIHCHVSFLTLPVRLLGLHQEYMNVKANEEPKPQRTHM